MNMISTFGPRVCQQYTCFIVIKNICATFRSGIPVGIFTLVSSMACAEDKAFDAVEIKTHQVTESIYMLEGEGGNIGVCVGEDGVFVIDDQYAPLSAKIVKAISKISKKPVQFVVNTHHHRDHTDGNEKLADKGAVIVSHDNSRNRIEAYQLKKMAEEGLRTFPKKSLPVITFSESITFHYNDDTINIFHVAHAHTDGDLIIHFKQANVFHMGDVFVRYGFPFIDIAHGGNINGMISALERVSLLADDHTRFIPGHGEISTKKDLVYFKNGLIHLRDAVKNEIDKGKSKEEIIALNPIKKYVDEKADVRNIVSTIFESLKSD